MPPHCSAAEPTGTAPPRVRQLSAPLPRHKATCAVARLLSAPLGKLATRTNCRTVNHRSPPHCLKNHTDPGERGGPSRKRRQSPSSGIGHDSAVLKPTMRLLQYPRPADDRQNQGLAPAKEATAKAPVRDWPGRQLSSGQSYAGACRAGSQVRAGPSSSNTAPSRARHRTGGKERVISPAPHSGRCGGFAPRRRGSRRQRSGSGSGESFPHHLKLCAAWNWLWLVERFFV